MADNEIQQAVVAEFVPRFADSSDVLYMGDAKNSGLVCRTEKLAEIGIKLKDLKHKKCPDLLLLDAGLTTLCVVEAYNSKIPSQSVDVMIYERRSYTTVLYQRFTLLPLSGIENRFRASAEMLLGVPRFGVLQSQHI